MDYVPFRYPFSFLYTSPNTTRNIYEYFARSYSVRSYCISQL